MRLLQPELHVCYAIADQPVHDVGNLLSLGDKLLETKDAMICVPPEFNTRYFFSWKMKKVLWHGDLHLLFLHCHQRKLFSLTHEHLPVVNEAVGISSNKGLFTLEKPFCGWCHFSQWTGQTSALFFCCELALGASTKDDRGVSPERRIFSQNVVVEQPIELPWAVQKNLFGNGRQRKVDGQICIQHFHQSVHGLLIIFAC